MKILLITANFAPRSASPAVRTVNYVKYLARLGHEIHVVTYTDEFLTIFSDADDELSKKVPSSVQISRVPAGILRRALSRRSGGDRKNAQLAKKSLSSNPLISLLVPDPHVDSVPTFIKTGCSIIAEWKPDVVITHGYPFSMHWVGARIKKRFPTLFWVADYGDPWVGDPVVELPRPQWRKRLDKWLEKRWISSADLLTVTTEPTKELYEQHYSFLQERIEIIPMGFDPDDFESMPLRGRPGHLAGKILFVHAGRIYPQARDPSPLIEAVGQLASQCPALASKLAIVLVGETDQEVLRLIKSNQCESFFHILEWVPVADSIAWMRRADWLLLFGNKGGIQIPGKIYQYIGANRPIFMTQINLADPSVDVVNSTENAVVVPNEAEFILEALKSVLGGEGSNNSTHPVSDRSRFSWPVLMHRLSQRIELIRS
ncbi:glycosyltransferase [Amphibiibacter pelophylacis]|uniref:Glycosyltransferase n=1 Tax=Amphibiibacter pelophylacis TaxID=1799477 RepID=A0ACC6NZ71_9BURK